MVSRSGGDTSLIPFESLVEEEGGALGVWCVGLFPLYFLSFFFFHFPHDFLFCAMRNKGSTSGLWNEKVTTYRQIGDKWPKHATVFQYSIYILQRTTFMCHTLVSH